MVIVINNEVNAAAAAGLLVKTGYLSLGYVDIFKMVTCCRFKYRSDVN